MNDRLHNAVASIAPPIVASPAKRIQAFTGDPDFMSSLARGLAVVQAFQERKRHLTIAQISHRTEIPRAAVRRCLYTLIKLGYATTDGRTYSLLPKVLTLGHAYLSSTPLAVTAQPYLDRMSEQLHEACNMATLEGDDILYIARSGQIGRLLANDLKSAMVRADLQDIDPKTGQPVSYVQIAQRLEDIRAKYSSADIEINIVGFAKLVGDVVEGLNTVMGFFAIAFLITGVLLWVYSRSWRLTLVALFVALLPVIWLLGLLPLLGLGIDPMSILVPFLIFSIGVSHAVQMTNAWKQEVLGGSDSVTAAKAAFSKIFIPGALALLMNALGFGVIMLIDIPIVHELGVTACIGVMLMIITNKIMLPLIIAHLRLEPRLMTAKANVSNQRHPLWWRVSALATPGPALWVFALSLVLLAVGAIKARELATGDIGSGAPELRADSRYNQDNQKIISNYSIGLDVLSVFLTIRDRSEACLDPAVMRAVETFDYKMREVPGVQSVQSVAGMSKQVIAGNNEGNPRWAAIPGSSQGLQQGAYAYSPDSGLVTDGCQQMQILVFLTDHEGATVAHVLSEAKRIINSIQVPGVSFKLAGGNIGVMAASNEAVKQAEVVMLSALFISVALFCLLTFRSVRAVLCILVPLAIVAVLCNALMALLGIGLKVATLPVMALGVGVGVDYGIYLYERIEHEMAEGQSLREAFYRAMCQRGTAAVFTALTMSLGVCTWVFAPLKFQADMGVLLAFMFMVNVLGAIFLLPALAAWFNLGKPLVSKHATLAPKPVVAAEGCDQTQSVREV